MVPRWASSEGVWCVFRIESNGSAALLRVCMFWYVGAQIGPVALLVCLTAHWLEKVSLPFPVRVLFTRPFSSLCIFTETKQKIRFSHQKCTQKVT